MPVNHDPVQVLESPVAVESGDGEVPLEERNLVAGEELDGLDASQHETPISKGAGSVDIHHVDSKEDMFVDASDELNADNREAAVAANESENEEVSQDKLDTKEIQFGKMDNGAVEDDGENGLEGLQLLLEKAVSRKESVEREYKEEREAFAREVADLRHQIEALTDKRSLAVENEERTVVVDVTLHEMVSDCSKFLESVKEERLRDESMIRELQGVLCTKDREIEDLNVKVTELSVSGDIASCYLNSVVEAGSEVQLEKKQHIEVIANRMLASLATVVSQEELLDNSVNAKITHVEKCTSLLIDKYCQILYETDQLGQCLSKDRSDFSVQEEFGSIFVDARDELCELKRREVELGEKLNNLEDENRKLVEKVDKDKEMIDAVNAELGKMKMELEQEKNRCVNTKEKLSMAVTKGKALVHHRDALKQSLAEKTKEVEKCLIELQEKSSALAAAELSKGELEQMLMEKTNELEKCLIELQGKSSALEAAELSKGELEQSLAEKANELEKCLIELQEKSSALEAADLSKGELEQSLAEKTNEIESRLIELQQKSSALEASEQSKGELEQSLMEKTNELDKCLIELQEKLNALGAAELSKGELQQSLAEKTNEIEKCLIELQQKSSALEASEQSKGEVEQSLAEKTDELDKCLIELQEKLSTLEASELSKGELQQSLADKTIEIEKCLIELQQKSSALEASEQSKGELVKSESSFADMQETLSQRNLILENFEEILSQTDVPEELQSMDIVERVKWLADERNQLKGVSLDYNKLKIAISLIDLPENIFFSDLESRLGWLRESFYQAKDEINMLRFQIERLSATLSTEIQEKDYIQKELDDVACRHKEVVENATQVSLEKDQMVRMLLDSSGMTMEYQEGVYQTSSDLAMLIDRCFGKIREQTSVSSVTSHADAELFERIQSLLYVRDQELNLCEEILGEEMLVRSQVNDLSDELRVASQQLAAVKEEKDSLQKDLERSEEKSALLREKLSMAVKKGKGLVQDRENLKRLLDEKNKEIEKLKLELQQQVSTVGECKGQINMLSADLECIPKLEADLVAMKEQRDQLERFLSQSNNMLQRVIESIDGIVLPVDSVFEEPVEKVNWLAGYINECQHAKTQAEQELEKVMEEASTLASKLTETEATMKSLEDGLLVAENNVSQLSEEKREIEEGKKNTEQDLQKAVEEASSMTSKFAEACVTRKTLEDALSMVENTISELISEKEEAQDSRAATEMELEKVREEVANQTSKLAEAYNTIKSLKNALSQAETNVALLTNQNNDAEAGRIILADELKKLKEETESQASKLADSFMTIKSLEDALVKAEKKFSVLEGEKRIAEQEISTLNSKLNACMEELAGTSGSLESRSVEFIGYLNDLQVLLKDESLFSKFYQCFERKFKNLKDMDLIISDISHCCVDEGSAGLQGDNVIEENSHMTKPFLNDLDDTVNIEMENGGVNAADGNDISLCFKKTAEGFKIRNKILVDKFEVSSTSIDELIATLLRKLGATRDDVINVFEKVESLKQKVKNLEMNKQEQERALAVLENDVTILHSASSEAARELQFEVKNNLLDLSSFPELGKLRNNLLLEVQKFGGDDTTKHQQKLDGSKYVNTAQKLSSVTRKMQTMMKLFESTSTVAAAIIQDLQNKLRETTAAFEKAVEERDLNQNRVSGLEADMEALQVSCGELRCKVEEFEAKEGKWHEKEAEVSSLDNEAEDPLLSAFQIRALFDKINGIDIPFAESVGDLESHSPSNVKKLFYIIDSVTEMWYQINLLSHEKEELQSTLSTQILEIEHLKEKVETYGRNMPDSEEMKTELSELTFGLEKIIDMSGGSEFVGEQKSSGVRGLLPVLEKQVMVLLFETENSKAKAQELGTKLLGSQKVVDELLTKVKMLEDSPQGRSVQPEIVQERSIFEAPTLPSESEISEIEDVGSLGKNAIAPVPTAAHARTMRKGSTDHLAINIDSESVGLINNEETDEDKGHIFKSLNTSGLIPNQGKMIADRIDGIWVSGSRLLMSRPRARLGLVAYWLFLHLWLLGTIL